MKEIIRNILKPSSETNAKLISLPPHIPYGVPDPTLSSLTGKPTSETICLEPMFEIQGVSINNIHSINGTTRKCVCVECAAEFNIHFFDNDIEINPIYIEETE